jgi:membrane fusion protein, multidrug efflux system
MRLETRNRRIALWSGPGVRAGVALVALAGLAGCSGPPRPKAARFPVTVARSEDRTVPYEIEATGTVEPRQTVAVNAQVGGVILRVAFREGDDVRAGQSLFQIDSRPFAVDRERAIAALAHDRAQAADARAQVEREAALVDKQYVSREEYDSKRAAADALEASVRADSAALVSANLNLEYALVRSPIDGRTGNLLAHVGNLVKENDVGNPLVTINQLKPILVRFAVPQGELPAILRESGHHLQVTAIADTGAHNASTGELTFVDNTVDAATGTILLKAEFENHDAALWPGQFVRVRLRLYVQPNARVVPSIAVSASQTGTFVYVVAPDSTVSARPVQVQRTFADWSVISTGLEAGETVVTDGQQRLTPGARVVIRSGASHAAGVTP